MNKELLELLILSITETQVRKLCKERKQELGFDLERAMFPVNPFEIEPSISINDALVLVAEWAVVRESIVGGKWDIVGDSVWYSVSGGDWDRFLNSVRDSIIDSVWYSGKGSFSHSIGESEWDSVLDIVRAYESSIYFEITEWFGVDHKEGVNPFQPAIDLWEAGYVSSFDGKTQRLRNKYGVVWASEYK